MRNHTKRKAGQSVDAFLAEQLKDAQFTEEYRKTDWQYQAARAVIQLRIQHHLTQEQLAKLVDVPQSTIARIESMSFSPTVRTLNKIAAATGTQLSIGFIDAEPKHRRRKQKLAAVV